MPPRRPAFFASSGVIPSGFGTTAITTSRSAMTPLVVQSLRPVSSYAAPPSIGTAWAPIRAGSLPTSGSVSRKALTSFRATSGRYFFFCSAVPKLFTGSGTPIDWCAESSVPMLECQEPASARARL